MSFDSTIQTIVVLLSQLHVFRCRQATITYISHVWFVDEDKEESLCLAISQLFGVYSGSQKKGYPC